MVRFVIIGVVIAVALTLYALVDAAMTDGSRARGVNKPVWIVIIAVLPVIGALLWFFIGKGSAAAQTARRIAPDDDPRFSGTRLSSSDLDAHMRDLEDRLRELDDETFPGEERAGRRDSAAPVGADADAGADAGSVLDESSSESSAPGLDAGAVSAGPEDTLSTGGEGASRSPRGDGADGATDAPAAASDTGALGGGAPTGDTGADGDARESTADAGADAADADARQRGRRQPRGAAEGPGTRSDGDPKP